jgi:hypothetical protein
VSYDCFGFDPPTLPQRRQGPLQSEKRWLDDLGLFLLVITEWPLEQRRASPPRGCQSLNGLTGRLPEHLFFAPQLASHGSGLATLPGKHPTQARASG